MLIAVLLFGALLFVVGATALAARTGRRWLPVIEECREALGGELTPGNLLLPPRLWLRTDDGLSLVVGLTTRGAGGRELSLRTVGAGGSMRASTRLSVDGDGIPGDMAMHRARVGPTPLAVEARRVSTGIADFDRRVEVEGPVAAALSRLGADRRPAVAAAVAQGATLLHGEWVIERPEPIMRSNELVGLARLLLAAARATRGGEFIADERLCESVRRDPEPGFRLACLECLATRAGMWRERAIEVALDDPEAELRLRAAQWAGPGGQATLIALARSAPEAMRVDAIASLADGPVVRELLEELALGGGTAVRAAALGAMIRIGHAPTALLERFLRHPDPALRTLALRALRPVGAPAIEYALAALDDPSSVVVRAAVEALGLCADVRLLPRLRAVRAGALDAGLRAALERAAAAIALRPAPEEAGRLALAGGDAPEAGRLALDHEQRGQLSQGLPAPLDLFADAGQPRPATAPSRPTPAGVEVSPRDETQ